MHLQIVIMKWYTLVLTFKVHNLYDNKNMITSTQITKTEIVAFIAVLLFKLLSR